MALTYSTELVRRTAKSAFWTGYWSLPTYLTTLAMRVSSDQDQETYPWLGAAPRPAQGSAPQYTPAPEFSWTVTNIEYSSGVPIKKRLQKLDKLGAVADLIQNLGEKARKEPDRTVSQMMNDGDATAGYDTQFFFDTDHTDPGAVYTTNQDNDLSYNVTTTTDPTAYEASQALLQAMEALIGFKDDRGDPAWPGDPMTMTIEVHVPTGYWGAFETARVSPTLSNAGAQEENPVRERFTLHANPWIDAPATDATFYTFLTNARRKPFIYQVIDEVDVDVDEDFDTKDIKARTYGDWAVGYGDWRTAIKTTLT